MRVPATLPTNRSRLVADDEDDEGAEPSAGRRAEGPQSVEEAMLRSMADGEGEGEEGREKMASRPPSPGHASHEEVVDEGEGAEPEQNNLWQTFGIYDLE